MCSTLLVEPPMATSSAIALPKAALDAMLRGRTESSSSAYQRLANSTTRDPARRNRSRRATCVASVEPLPGNDSPRASVRQFIELAVNMPEHDPQVGQAACSSSVSPASLTFSAAEALIALIKFVCGDATPST